MDREQIQEQVRKERLALADFLEGLSAEDWARPSLCAGWTVHEVLAHVTLSNRDTLRTVVVEVIRARGNWDRANADAAIRRAAQFTPAELIAQLRAGADNHRRSPGAGVLDPLADIIVHGQDIARPLGRTLRTSPKQVIAPLEYVLGSMFYGAKKRLRGKRLVATDVQWSHGDGAEEVRAPVVDLLMIATGRTVDPSLRSG
ncbi:maleylpyruvate isomerase family mycothiol-dependent enzyme [Nocardia sp. XZ_19_385]|uniref:maleylpyruvate isomerase family mycothiol-dependent enzyme n=1 Tax=Nocardia sp. XZ_19_385 TaxID=2769488 RepID=UPI00188E0334|nr:maleylpyruvate isomerase family mycothiol-dependent enzyme [Nocardia sp. XZ_19_385]